MSEFMDPKLPPRFWEKCIPEPNSGCWLWIGTICNNYGSFSVHGRNKRSHRVSYEALVGQIPDGLTIDHLCNNTVCVNPAHLAPATARDNVLRGSCPPAVNARRDVCQRGHAYTDKRHHNGYRVCWICNNESKRRYDARYREKKRRLASIRAAVQGGGR